MKYIFVLIAFALSACGKKENPTAGQETKSPAASETAEQAPLKILPVCDRTPYVRDEILARSFSLSFRTKCEDITAQDLNKIKEMLFVSSTYKVGDFSGLTNLKELNIWDFKMQQIPKGLFVGLTNLEKLTLTSHQLSRLKNGDFPGLTNLKKLNLSCYTIAKENCTITTLSAGTFNNLSRLENLMLSDLHLKSLPPNVFDPLVSLKKLSLSCGLDEICKITKLPVGIFKGLSRLEELNLTNQPLESLPAGIFDKLRSLQKLYLWGNSLSEARKAQIREKCEERNILLTI